jgi:tRNA (guanine37-N1)-methyltransferase
MIIDIISIFPEMFEAMKHGLVGRAIEQGMVDLRIWNPRQFSGNKHGHIDDKPYGGGPGMVMRAEPLKKTLDAIKKERGADPQVSLLCPKGKTLRQEDAKPLSEIQHWVLICGRYEGIDQRFIDAYVDSSWSIGDYVLTGGELPCMVTLDVVMRWLPGMLGNQSSKWQDSFVDGLLDHPCYTRPKVFHDTAVPEVLCSGDHQAIAAWRAKQARDATQSKRPDLLKTKKVLTQ